MYYGIYNPTHPGNYCYHMAMYGDPCMQEPPLRRPLRDRFLYPEPKITKPWISWFIIMPYLQTPTRRQIPRLNQLVRSERQWPPGRRGVIRHSVSEVDTGTFSLLSSFFCLDISSMPIHICTRSSIIALSPQRVWHLSPSSLANESANLHV